CGSRECGSTSGCVQWWRAVQKSLEETPRAKRDAQRGCLVWKGALRGTRFQPGTQVSGALERVDWRGRSGRGACLISTMMNKALQTDDTPPCAKPSCPSCRPQPQPQPQSYPLQYIGY